METTTENVLVAKTRELCQSIMEQPEYESLRRHVNAFMNDEKAQQQFQSLSDRGDYLHHKQSQGLPLSNEEIAAFEAEREAFLNNPVAREFFGAKQTIDKMQETVSRYVAKTFELGRIPNDDDFDHGGCGHGCGCSH